MSKEKEEYLTIKEVAAELKVKPPTIWRLIKNNLLIAARVGRVWRIRRSDLEEYLESERDLKW